MDRIDFEVGKDSLHYFFLTHKSALQYNINLVNNIMPIGVIAIEFESFFVTTKDQFVR